VRVATTHVDDLWVLLLRRIRTWREAGVKCNRTPAAVADKAVDTGVHVIFRDACADQLARIRINRPFP
jgi:hypothetical protein